MVKQKLVDNLLGMLRKGSLLSVKGYWEVPPDALFNSGSKVGGGISFWYRSLDERKLPGPCLGLEKICSGGSSVLGLGGDGCV